MVLIGESKFLRQQSVLYEKYTHFQSKAGNFLMYIIIWKMHLFSVNQKCVIPLSTLLCKLKTCESLNWNWFAGNAAQRQYFEPFWPVFKL